MNETLGERLADAPDLGAYLALERQVASTELVSLFEHIDSLTQEFLLSTMSIVKARFRFPETVSQSGNKDLWIWDPARVISLLSPTFQDYVQESFSGDVQISNGAAWTDATHSFYVPVSAFSVEKIEGRLADNPALLFYLSVIAPAMTMLTQVMDIRGGSPLLSGKEFQTKLPSGETKFDIRKANLAWFERTSQLYGALEINTEPFFGQVQSVSQFFNMTMDRRHKILLDVVDQITVCIRAHNVGQRVRAIRLQAAAQSYYRLMGKAKKEIPRRRFLKKDHEWLLSGYFQGSWLKFLEYIGESPAEDDYVPTAIPKPQILMPFQRTTKTADLPSEERAKILDSIDPSGSGLRARLNLAKEFWDLLLKAHENQRPGRPSLWGLVADQDYMGMRFRQNLDINIYNPGLYKSLPTSILSSIQDFYGRDISPQYPVSRGTTLFPYGIFCKHLNPALAFWHGVGLTIWFLTQGPYSRTDIPGMPHYYRREIAELAELGCPIDSNLFTDLAKIRVVSRHQTTVIHINIDIFSGTSTTENPRTSISEEKGATRSYEELKRVFLMYMQRWTGQYLDNFWQEGYRRRVMECGQRYNRLRETKGQDPTLRQFMDQKVADVVNEYFDGDVFRLLEALGEPLPRDAQLHDNHLIRSVEELENCVVKFASTSIDEPLRFTFIDYAIRYCLLWERRGEAPTPSTFQSGYYYQQLCKSMGIDSEKDPERAWHSFQETVTTAAADALIQ